MSPTLDVKGSLPEIIRNNGGLYDGDLKRYFRILFFQAENLNNPYHNFRHMCHVVWLCWTACRYYEKELTPRQRRALLIAAMFHDFNHTGKFGPDSVNIQRAIDAVDQYLDPADRDLRSDIVRMIKATEYPYKVPIELLDLSALILRDADMSQAFSVAWIQQVVLGLSSEWGKTPLEVLKLQAPFLNSLTFHTAWAREQFPDAQVNQKIREAQELILLLTDELPPTER